MTSTSFNSPQSCCRDLFRNTCEVGLPSLEGGVASRASLEPPKEYAAQAQRMKAFAGQCKFQAPIAADFSRGMLADGQSPGSNTLKHTGLINSMAAWWRRLTAD